ncbi:ATP-grasp fold amidoligase family protein [Rhodococcus qingshengii]|uniref:ATP-grasp fold amidoligase family protein n=1 Tax=Rhodococcus qingshengii TaxID=334542 RepID=UPI00287F6D8F|nr:ATP-grasp fold amidoligase family protein [Rhodococcus qingshengii]
MGRSLPRKPSRFTEKIQWRIIRDRRELISRCGDKLAMKMHAAVTDPDILIPETLWFGTDLKSVYNRDWGTDWVLKPIGGSGYTVFGSGSLRESGVDLDAVGTWKVDAQARLYGEWTYKHARPGYLIEKRIETAQGESPNDLRFFVFDGAVRVIQVDSPRTSVVHRRFYTPDWVPLDVNQGKGKVLADPVPAPERLSDMIKHASRIGADFDFIRVDLYEALGKIYFGEITPYPAGGTDPYTDDAFDEQLGSYWTLPASQRR